MNTTEPNPIKENLKEVNPLSGISSIPSIAVIKKTFIFDLCTWRRLLISVVFMLLVPALIFAFMPLPSGEKSIIEIAGLGFVTWYYNFAILFPIIIIGSTGPLISEELRTGTMLFLVSKPINRTKIVISKFVALYLFGIVVSVVSLSIVCIIAAIKYPFVDIASYLGMNFLYSLIIIFFFGGITMGFSSIFERPRNVLLFPLALVIFSFLVFMMFKPLLIGYGYGVNRYEKYLLYNFDIGYHFANVFMWIGESFVPEIWDYLGGLFTIFGITKYTDTGDGFEYVITHYYHPVASLFYLIIIGGIFLIIGTLVLKKRDIS
jgi:ABC-type transport system involved in multi-copper enzyme maturation permease subunit